MAKTVSSNLLGSVLFGRSSLGNLGLAGAKVIVRVIWREDGATRIAVETGDGDVVDNLRLEWFTTTKEAAAR